jgi:ribose transport system ATP-binding protein
MTHSLISLSGVKKRFGPLLVLTGVDLDINPGQIVAIMGHNGAGKSTLMNILTGIFPRDEGTISVEGQEVRADFNVKLAQDLGIRCVFQELSLCNNLTVAENVRVYHRGLRGFGWRKNASALIQSKLDEIFPSHGISPDDIVENLSIGQRQMVEVARAFTVTDQKVKLAILDEPTSAMDGQTADQLMQFMETFCEGGGAVLFISHRMVEIMNHSHRIVVLQDGSVVGEGRTNELTENQIIEMMGMVEVDSAPAVAKTQQAPKLRVEEDIFRAHSGEVIGLAGLASHGQRELLLRAFSGKNRRKGDPMQVNGSVAYVAGDRQREGIFPLWSVERNISAGLSEQVAKAGLIDLKRERNLAQTWKKQLDIKVDDITAPITSLSGGNQQKILVARAFAKQADIVLLDDPLRGVDIGTKREIYSQVREAANAGQCFLWYMTETAELVNCDVIYIFYQGKITDVIPRAELTEQRVIQSSFKEVEVTHGG